MMRVMVSRVRFGDSSAVLCEQDIMSDFLHRQLVGDSLAPHRPLFLARCLSPTRIALPVLNAIRKSMRSFALAVSLYASVIRGLSFHLADFKLSVPDPFFFDVRLKSV